MKVKLYWPDCEYQNYAWGSDPVDTFWLECTPEEAKQKILPLIPDSKETDMHLDWMYQSVNAEHPNLFFLVARDLRSIMPFPWYYPYSGQWNAYSPFTEIQEVTVEELSELAGLIIDDSS